VIAGERADMTGDMLDAFSGEASRSDCRSLVVVTGFGEKEMS
jgi:hypothetical protein